MPVTKKCEQNQKARNLSGEGAMMKNDQAISPGIEAAKDGQINVWLIEDHVEFRNTVMRVLALDADFKAEVFTRCEEALARLKQGGSAHVILLDIGLPGMSGLDGITEFKTISPATQIIMLTSFDDPPKVRKAVQSGATGYLLKTTGAKQIGSRIREVLSGGAPLDTRIARHVLTMLTSSPGGDRYGLAPREREVLEQLVAGKTIKEIASTLGVSYYTVDTYLRRIYQKMDVQSRSHAVSKALQARVV
jgi:DNA-binding NarL/FixJ family response regulator